jgi:hypothetical protein
MPSDLERELTDALRTPVATPDAARRDALERELLAKLPARRDERGWSKWLIGAGLGTALAVGACALPSDYSARLGHRLAIVVDVAKADDIDHEALVEFVTEHYHPDELRMGIALERVREHGQPERASMRIEIDAVGEDLDTDVIWSDLVASFPELEGARLEDEELQGMVHGTLGGRLSQAWLDIVIDKGGVEEAKQQVIDQLRAQGVEGDAVVDIVDHTGADGQRRREVRVMIEGDEH